MKPQAHIGHLFYRVSWNDLDTNYLRRLIETARAEDIEGAGLKKNSRTGDVTTLALQAEGNAAADLVARKPMNVCGLNLVPLVLEVYGGGAFEPFAKDGQRVEAGAQLGRITGDLKIMLQAERVLLNFLQRLSGVATFTAAHVAALGESPTKLLDTRKTTPGLRALEKYAVACGGAHNHRMGLFDRVMLKDNHLAGAQASAGERLAQAVRDQREKNPDLAIEVEIDSLTQIPPVLSAAPDVIMLDNFSIQDIKQAVAFIGDKAWTEVSGTVTLETLPSLAHLGVDFISSGAIIHQAPWIDIALDWKE